MANTSSLLHRLFVVDDHAIVREGIKALLRRIPGAQVCGEARSALEAVQGVHQLEPSLVVLDLQLQGEFRLDLLPQLQPHLRKVVVLSLHDTDEVRLACARAGAYAFVSKGSGLDDLVAVVKTALGVEQAAVATLTEREQEVLGLIAAGLTSRQIAEHLVISYHTVESHRTNIARKLKLNGRAEVLRYALDHASGFSR